MKKKSGPKKQCPTCSEYITTRAGNYAKHVKTCIGKKRTIDISAFKQVDSKYECPYCQKLYTKHGIGTHVWRMHTEEGSGFDPNAGYNKDRVAWNKGLTKSDHPSIANAGESFSRRYNEGKFELGKPHTDETKKKLSEIMKQRHKDGAAHNIGQSRWNNEPSYPEQFFMQVIENHFEDKNYIRERPFMIYSLDFAWDHKKKCIEIDGEQHQRFEEYMERDRRKDKALHEDGWEVLRIAWKDMFNDTKTWIAIAKDFIE